MWKRMLCVILVLCALTVPVGAAELEALHRIMQEG